MLGDRSGGWSSLAVSVPALAIALVAERKRTERTVMAKPFSVGKRSSIESSQWRGTPPEKS